MSSDDYLTQLFSHMTLNEATIKKQHDAKNTKHIIEWRRCIRVSGDGSRQCSNITIRPCEYFCEIHGYFPTRK